MALLRIRQQGIDFQDGSRMTSLFSIIPQNTKLLIHASTAPTGWTKLTGNGYNNAALRVMSQGTFNSTTQTGTVFTSAFKQHQKSYTIQSTITGLSVGNHTLTTPEIPKHSHNMPNAGGGAGVSNSTPSNQGGQRADMTSGTTGNFSSDGIHAHPSTYQTVTGPLSTTHSLDVKYVDMIMCSYNGFTYTGTADSGS